MITNIALFALLVAKSAASSPAEQVHLRSWCPDQGDGTYRNPILWGDWPDPDVIRVGHNFYFSSTSMHYVPGCPILQSKDLVNWHMAGYAVDRYREDPRWDMKGGELYLNGSWATTLRYHNGRYYLGFCTPQGWGTPQGHFSMCVADRIDGPWKRTIFPQYLYDPGLLFDDDGKVYVFHGQGTLYVTELAGDALSVAGSPKKIWSGLFNSNGQLAKVDAPFGLEGSHAYKIGSYYYVLCAGGGTEGFQICLRSKNLYGPYEWKRVCKDDSSYPPNGLHQGGLVQLENGDWWFLIMQDRGPIGRVPNLVPVKWIDGWPMLGPSGKGTGIARGPKPAGIPRQPVETPATSDEFNSPRLGLQWQWNHNPDDAKWSLTARPGYLRLLAHGAPDLTHALNTLTQRTIGPNSEATTVLDVGKLRPGDHAGLGVFESPYGFVAVTQGVDGRTVDMVLDGKTIESSPIGLAKRVWFRASVSDSKFEARFEFSLDGHNFRAIGRPMQMALGLPWTANRFALFNFSDSPNGVDGIADFDWIRIRVKS